MNVYVDDYKREAFRSRLADIASAVEPQVYEAARKTHVLDAFIQMVMENLRAHSKLGSSVEEMFAIMGDDLDALEGLIIDLNLMVRDTRREFE